MARPIVMQRSSSLLLLVVLAMSTVLGACSAGRPATARHASTETSSASTASGDESAVLGRDWIFVEVAGFDGSLPSPPPVAGFILTRAGNDRLTGTTACNRLGGSFDLDAATQRLRFIDLRNTRMMCDRVAADTEYAVLQAMIATDSYRLANGRLELWGDGRRLAVLAPS